MIEIMSRDGSLDKDELSGIANMIETVFGISTDILSESDIRAMVFWSPEDIEDIVEEYGLEETFSGLDMDDYDDLLKEAEPVLHQTMLQEGRDVLTGFLKEKACQLEDSSKESTKKETT